MASVNKVIILGHLGRDPEVRYSPSGTAVASFSVATSRAWKDKTSGERQEETEWHRIVFYDRLAEVAGEWLKKGRPVYIEGRLRTRQWEKDGVTRYSTEIVGESLQLLGGREEGDQKQRPQSQAPAPQPSAEQRRSQASKPATTGGFDDMEDDIPF